MADKIKTFSQAIRVGITFKPQCFGHFAEDDKSCVIQAAAEAIGFETGYMAWRSEEFLKRWPALIQWKKCPECLDSWGNGVELCMHLNDKHRWTRERIADHLEGLGL